MSKKLIEYFYDDYGAPRSAKTGRALQIDMTKHSYIEVDKDVADANIRNRPKKARKPRKPLSELKKAEMLANARVARAAARADAITDLDVVYHDLIPVVSAFGPYGKAFPYTKDGLVNTVNKAVAKQLGYDINNAATKKGTK